MDLNGNISIHFINSALFIKWNVKVRSAFKEKRQEAVILGLTAAPHMYYSVIYFVQCLNKQTDRLI